MGKTEGRGREESEIEQTRRMIRERLAPEKAAQAEYARWARLDSATTPPDFTWKITATTVFEMHWALADLGMLEILERAIEERDLLPTSRTAFRMCADGRSAEEIREYLQECRRQIGPPEDDVIDPLIGDITLDLPEDVRKLCDLEGNLKRAEERCIEFDLVEGVTLQDYLRLEAEREEQERLESAGGPQEEKHEKTATSKGVAEFAEHLIRWKDLAGYLIDHGVKGIRASVGESQGILPDAVHRRRGVPSWYRFKDVWNAARQACDNGERMDDLRVLPALESKMKEPEWKPPK